MHYVQHSTDSVDSLYRAYSQKQRKYLHLKHFSFFKALLTYVKKLILNTWDAMQQEIANLYEFLYHMTPAFIFENCVLVQPFLEKQNRVQFREILIQLFISLRKKYSNTEFFLVRIFLYLD